MARAAIRRRVQDIGGAADEHYRAKNVILLVGDGMGVATVTAARIMSGQRRGQSGEEYELAWDRFPAVALARTYNADAQVGESSACATALLCGVKANLETVGLDARGRFEHCFSSFSSRVPSLVDWAQQQGKATGIVTTTRITHATPAALYAHSPSRYWEDDSKVPPASRKACKDLARQLMEDDPGRNINPQKNQQLLPFIQTPYKCGTTAAYSSNTATVSFATSSSAVGDEEQDEETIFFNDWVLLGGGRRHWLPKVARDPELANEEGRRLDGRNLIDDWVRDKKRRGLRSQYVWNRSQLEEVDLANIDHLLGLFAYSHLDFEADRDPSPTGDPSLVDMTVAALKVLLRNPKGFFLFVEGGRIDHAHHYNNAYRALDETLSLEAALLAAMQMVDLSETLLVVTADHSHVLTMGGLATPRGNPILGIDSKVSDVDGLPYNTLLYGNGPGHAQPRPVPSNMSVEEQRNNVHASAVPRQWATHGGEDVPIFAQGPLATRLFSGSVDQSYIPHAIAYIACLGEYASRCANKTRRPVDYHRVCEVGGVSTSRDGRVVPVVSSVMADDSANKRMKMASSSVFPTVCEKFLSFSVLFTVICYKFGMIWR